MLLESEKTSQLGWEEESISIRDDVDECCVCLLWRYREMSIKLNLVSITIIMVVVILHDGLILWQSNEGGGDEK